MPGGPWEKYGTSADASAGPWAKYRTPDTPPAPPDQFAQDRDTVNKWAEGHSVVGPAARFLVSGGQSAANAITGTPGYVYHSIVDPPEPHELVLTPAQRVIGRLSGLTAASQAAGDYASGQVTPKGAASVLPEALGTGLGTVAGGAVYGKMSEVPREVNHVVPSLPRSGAGHGLLEKWYEKHPISSNRFLDATATMEDELSSTKEKLPPPIEGLRKTIASAEAARAQGIPWDDFNFKAARDALDRLNSHIDFKNPTPANALYRRAAGALAEDIMESTGRPSAVAPEGFQADYQRMIDETRVGHKIIRAGEKAGPVVGALAGYGLGRELGAPMGAEFLMGVGGKMIGRSVAGGLMRSIIEREAGAPNISAPPTPPTGAPPVPPSMAAPPPTGPPVAPMPPVATAAPPMPPNASAASEAAATQALIEHVARARAAGTLGRPQPTGMSPTAEALWQQGVFGEKPLEDIGTKVRQANPEPTRAEVKAAAKATSGGNPTRDTQILAQVKAEHPEWTLSQQLQEATKRAAGKPVPPPPKPIARNLPPEAYTRFLLAAKEGDISPGELERRFAKYGGGGVVPLRRG